MRNFLDELTHLLETKAASWPDADKVIAESVAIDIAELTHRSASGVPVPDEEWAVAKASIANLGAGAAVDGAAIFREWLGIVLAVVGGAVL